MALVEIDQSGAQQLKRVAYSIKRLRIAISCIDHSIAITLHGSAGHGRAAARAARRPPGVGMTIIDGIVRTQRSRNTPPAGKVPEIVPR